MAERVEQEPSAELCFECTQEVEPGTVTIRRIKRAYCPNCWIHHCDFRFRKRLFELGRPEKGSRLPSILDRPTEHVLIYYDGSQSSLALLHLIRDAVRANIYASSSAGHGMSSNRSSNDQQKILPLPFTFSVLFIYDEMNGMGCCVEKLNTLRDWQSETSSQFDQDFPIMVSSLEQSLSIRPDATSREKVDEDEGKEGGLIWQRIPSQSTMNVPSSAATTRRNEETSRDSVEFNSLRCSFPFSAALSSKLSLMGKNLKSETSKKDFYQILRENLMLHVAKECEAKKIFVPEEQTFMAIKMFSLMSLGRGAQLAEQMGLTTEIEGVKFARPLMDLSLDDLRDYLVCLKEVASSEEKRRTRTESGETSTSQPLLLATDKKELGRTRKIKAIQDQCEEFIVDLQHGFAATVPTLTRIGAKLKPQGDEIREAAGATAKETNDDGIPDKGSSSTGSDGVSGKGRICSFCKRNRNDTDDRESLELGLCYGCTNILRDMRDPSSFRAWLQGL